MELEGSLPGVHNCPPQVHVVGLQHAVSYGEELLTSCPTPKQEDYTFSSVRDCFCDVFEAQSSSPATWGRTMP
jgi:hypothetical protein